MLVFLEATGNNVVKLNFLAMGKLFRGVSFDYYPGTCILLNKRLEKFRMLRIRGSPIDVKKAE